MTNNWTDIGNATLVVVMGANPVENHPASIAHVNRARSGPGDYYDRAGNKYNSQKPAAKLVVIDPRKTRTAAIADMYVRIRPGTDIAFINGLMNYIFDATNTGTGLFAATNANKRARWEAFHEATAAKTLYTNAAAKVAITRPKYTDATFKVDVPAAGDYVRTDYTVGANTWAQIPEVAGMNPADNSGAPDVYHADSVFSKIKAHVAPYTPSVVANICGCTEAQLVAVAQLWIENSRCSSVANDADGFGATINDPKLANYRSTTMMYAMGLTQHTYGSQNVKSFATLQTLMGNMGRSGGGINALRGIHNVQGSTDMGLLYHLIPGYSANPTGTFASYMNGLYGNKLDGNGGADAYVFANAGLQQKGFYSMTKSFFSDTSYRGADGEGTSAVPETSTNLEGLFELWPTGNGDNHILMFRKMQPERSATTPNDKITATLVWGQNPAVTEPNQTMVRSGLKELDTLVVVDMFATETAMCDRKGDGVTYLIPASSHIEEAGSATNSGRVLQWRYQAAAPAGNTMTDLEMVMRFAKACDNVGAFDHIKNKWQSLGVLGGTTADAWAVLYGNQYGWTWGSAIDCEASAQKVYKQLCAPQNSGGTMWLYLDGWSTDTTNRGGGWPADPNRAKSRVKADADNAGGGHHLYKNWGYAWLVNRRVLYSNGDTPWDQNDGFQGPDQVARIFVSTKTGVIDYGTTYRSIHRLADKPFLPDNVTSPAGAAYAGRFPWHTEPYETSRPDLAAIWGYNSSGTGGNCLYSGTPRGEFGLPADGKFPLVLTSIRCVEHFQGGPITRNNSWNVEIEPEPWVEINSVDARNYGIADGDWVNVITARSDSTTDQVGRTPNADTSGSQANFGKGFRARVGVGLEGNQRTGVGVVAIPWHWGDQGLSTGARANDLCIDAMDANTTIPEYKACLCKIEKA